VLGSLSLLLAESSSSFKSALYLFSVRLVKFRVIQKKLLVGVDGVFYFVDEMREPLFEPCPPPLLSPLLDPRGKQHASQEQDKNEAHGNCEHEDDDVKYFSVVLLSALVLGCARVEECMTTEISMKKEYRHHDSHEDDLLTLVLFKGIQYEDLVLPDNEHHSI